jgi:CBS domain-containing protein/ribosomal protein S27AE
MKSGIKVGDVMTRRFVSVAPNVKIIECLKLMSQKNLGSLVILENKKLKGIITDRDILERIAKNMGILQKPVRQVMKKNLVTITPSKDISEAVILMEKRNVRRLPVVVKNTIIGLITKKDILKIKPGLFDILAQKMRISEEKEKLRRIAEEKDHWVKEGPCQECGASDLLYQHDGKYVCSLCKKSIKESKDQEIEEKEQKKIAHKIFNFLRRKERQVKKVKK